MNYEEFSQQWDTLDNGQQKMLVPFMILSWILFIYVQTGLLMIFIGTLHSFFDVIPAVGFWTTFWFNMIFGTAFNIMKRSLK